MKKKLFLLTVPLLLGLSCTACPKKEPPKPDNDYVTPPSFNEASIQIHYARSDRKFDNWALWLWEYPSGTGEEYAFNGIDEYGAIAAYPLSTWSNAVLNNGIGFIVKSAGSWASKDPDGDRVMDFSKIEKDEKDIYHVYLQTGDSNVYTSPELEMVDEITKAAFDGYNRIVVYTNTKMAAYKIYENDVVIADNTLEKPSNRSTFVFPEGKEASINNTYKVDVTFQDSQKTVTSSISVRSLYKTDKFKETYNYDGQLGPIYSESSTTFKVWSPISSDIKLRLYQNGTPKSVDSSKGSDTVFKEVTMVKDEKGVFSTTVEGDLDGYYYTYVVTNSRYSATEVVDPYAYSTGVNGARGMIVNFDKTNPEGYDAITVHPYDRKELVVYETHVADLTSSATWTDKADVRKYEKTFKGATIEGTTYTKGGVTVKTGFDHIKELGVNAVQLIPIFDQANDETNMTFNWGYNPSNYNALEGGYSTNPYDGKVRITEFKELVQAYNKAGINIIMDVVYNHMNGANGSNFDVLMPEYYFRYDNSNKLSNGSGCGNETASDMPMFQKFMIDSACFWAKEYKLGGFRFDLMGLHDLDTMAKLTAAVKEINPNITIYGEPWSGGTSPLKDSDSAKQVNGNRYQGYGAFNDQMRDALIKGGLNAATDKGWITNNTSEPAADDLNKISAGIKGITKTATTEIKDPDKTVNYVTCHDNYTLFDRITAAGITDEAIIKKMAMLANSVVLTSQATTFMLAGEEMLRTKGGDSNSYCSSYEVNELDYSRKIDNIDMFNNYKALISLKKSASGLHLDSNGINSLSVDVSKKNVIKYQITSSENVYTIIHVNGYNSSSLPTMNLEGETLYLDTLNSAKALSGATQLEAYETLITYHAK